MVPLENDSDLTQMAELKLGSHMEKPCPLSRNLPNNWQGFLMSDYYSSTVLDMLRHLKVASDIMTTVWLSGRGRPIYY